MPSVQSPYVSQFQNRKDADQGKNPRVDLMKNPGLQAQLSADEIAGCFDCNSNLRQQN